MPTESSKVGSDQSGKFSVESSSAIEQGLSAQPAMTTLEDPAAQIRTPAISTKDLVLLSTLPPLTAVSWIVSDGICASISRAFARLTYQLHPRRYQELGEILRGFLPLEKQPKTMDRYIAETVALHHLERFQLLRYHRPGSWHPKIAVVGREHLEHALAVGKGAVLWITFATFSDIISKVALRQLGYDVWHLSRHTHGHLSSSHFGIRFLNPIRTMIESRYLAERVVIDPADPKAALKRLEQLLADNRIVSITVGAEARRVTMAPFGPGHLPLAGGAPSLALKSGAALLPVFTERRPDGSFLVTIEEPLEACPTGSREQQISELIARESALLYRYFVRLPEQYYYIGLHRTRRRHESTAKSDLECPLAEDKKGSA